MGYNGTSTLNNEDRTFKVFKVGFLVAGIVVASIFVLTGVMMFKFLSGDAGSYHYERTQTVGGVTYHQEYGYDNGE